MRKHSIALSARFPTALSSLAERLGLPDLRGLSGLVAALFIDSLGSGAFLPFAVLYATVIAHISIATTGLILSLCAGVALPTAPVAGALVDRFGAQRLVVAANLLQGLGFAGYPFINSPQTLFVCGLLVATGSQAYYAANGSFIARIARPDQRARWYALMGACRGAGLGGGALLSGLAILLLSANGYRLLAAANALSFVVAALLIARIALPPAHASGAAPHTSLPRTGRPATGYGAVLRDLPFLGFTATNVLFSLITLSFSIVLPLYLLDSLRLPVWAPGVVYGANTALTIVAQTPVARWNERYRRTRALACSAGLFGAALLLLAGLGDLPRGAAGMSVWLAAGLAVALLLFTAATLVMAPLKNALITDAAPDALRGRYLAFYHLSWSVASIIGPAALTALYALSGGWVWLALSGVALLAIVALLRLDRALPLHAIQAQHPRP